MTAAPSFTAHGFVRVGVCTPKLALGNIAANKTEILRVAKSSDAQVLVFPELCLTGYSCADLFMNAAFRAQALQALASLCEEAAIMTKVVIVGLPLEVDSRLYNVAAVLHGGRVRGIVPKTSLPNAWEFYERRWFSPADTLRADARVTSIPSQSEPVPMGTDLLFDVPDVPGLRIGVEICEDVWGVIPPSSHAALGGATVIANLSASNELLGKAPYRRQLVEQQSARCVAAYLYSSAGPGESSTDTVFGGHSLIAENGSRLAETTRFSFETQTAVADIDLQRLQHDRLHNTSFRDAPACKTWRIISLEGYVDAPEVSSAAELHRPLARHPFVPGSSVDRSAVCDEIFAIQSTGLARRVMAAKPKTLVLGLSGGLDSTLALLVARHAIAAIDTKLITITMPGLGTTSRTKDNAVLLAEALGVELRTVSISEAVKLHLKDIGHDGSPDIAFENAQARERTQVLMDVANATGGLVVGTGDLSEAALGWCTYNGDHMSMYHVNTGVPKTLVRYLIAWCAVQPEFSAAKAVLEDILDTPISPELLPADADGKIAQQTEQSVGPYELVDFFLFHLVRHGCGQEKIGWLANLAFAGTYPPDEISHWLARFLQRFRTQQFKRSATPDGPKVGSVALSPRGDWRLPSDLAGGW